MKYWELVADKLSKAGWSLGWVLSRGFQKANDLDCWRAHRGDAKRFVARADEKLTAFLELESVIRTCGELL